MLNFKKILPFVLIACSMNCLSQDTFEIQQIDSLVNAIDHSISKLNTIQSPMTAPN
jgi:hypothetical protein